MSDLDFTTAFPELNLPQKKMLLRELIERLPKFTTMPNYGNADKMEGFRDAMIEVEEAMRKYILGE